MTIALRKGFVVAGILFLLNLTFLNKPFHIDDVYFLEVAQNIRVHPLDPFHGKVALMDQDFRIFKAAGKVPNTFEGMSHPPLVPYYLAFVIWLTGHENELILHLSFLVFILISAISLYSLSRRFTRFPAPTTLLILGSPVFLVNSQNLMTDVPMLSLLLAGLALFMNGLEENKASKLFLAGLLAGLTVVTRYAGLIIFPLLIAYAILQKQTLRKTLPALLGAALPIGAWFVQNLIYHKQLHILASAAHYRKFYEIGSFGFVDLLVKSVSDISGIGASALFLMLVLLILQHKKLYLFLLLLIPTLAIILIFKPGNLQQYSIFQLLLLWFFLSSGLFLLANCLTPWKNRSDGNSANSTRFLIFWMFFALITAIWLLPFGTGRYVLPALVPIILIIVRQIEDSLSAKNLLNTAVVTTLIFSCILANADNHFAGVYHTFPNSLKANFPQARIWYIGEWGFRFYMNEHGFKYLLSDDNTPQPEDLVVRAEIAGSHWMSPALAARCEQLKTVEFKDAFGVKILNPEAKAGFYSHGYGLLPCSYSKTALERFTIFRVIR